MTSVCDRADAGVVHVILVSIICGGVGADIAHTDPLTLVSDTSDVCDGVAVGIVHTVLFDSVVVSSFTCPAGPLNFLLEFLYFGQ